ARSLLLGLPARPNGYRDAPQDRRRQAHLGGRLPSPGLRVAALNGAFEVDARGRPGGREVPDRRRQRRRFLPPRRTAGRWAGRSQAGGAGPLDAPAGIPRSVHIARGPARETRAGPLFASIGQRSAVGPPLYRYSSLLLVCPAPPTSEPEPG